MVNEGLEHTSRRYKLEAYINLEQAMLELDLGGEPEFSERVKEITEDLWKKLATEDVNILNSRVGK